MIIFNIRNQSIFLKKSTSILNLIQMFNKKYSVIEMNGVFTSKSTMVSTNCIIKLVFFSDNKKVRNSLFTVNLIFIYILNRLYLETIISNSFILHRKSYCDFLHNSIFNKRILIKIEKEIDYCLFRIFLFYKEIMLFKIITSVKTIKLK